MKSATGAIVNADGTAIGSHDGYWRFTPGQRRGLRVNGSRPLYVLRTNAATNTVVVGPHEELATTEVETRGRLYIPVTHADVKLRYQSAAVPASIHEAEGGFTLRLGEPAFGIARGQVAVVYDEDAVVGAGVITDVA